MNAVHEPGCTGHPPTFGCPACMAMRRPPPRSRRRRLTHHNAQAFAQGRHPATGTPLNLDATCGDCVHCSAIRFAAAPTRYKCDLHLGGQSGAQTDIRLSWPACTRFEMVDTEAIIPLS